MARRKKTTKGAKPEPAEATGPRSPERKSIALALAVLFILLACLCTWFQFDYGDMMGYYDLYADAAIPQRG